MKQTLALALALLLTAGPALAQGAAAPTRIGAAAAVSGAVNAQTPGAVGRVVQSGKEIYLNDHVTTDAAGRLQVLLLDETIFTLGPNSDMVLDEFVYDPSNDAGKVAARVTKGVFRFVTGKVARRDPASMKVKLPVGTIGIRGTIAVGEAGDASSTAILMGPGGDTNTDEPAGSITFENNGVTRTMNQPGDGVTCENGKSPSGVSDLSAKANELNAKLDAPLDSKNPKDSGGGSATDQSGQNTASGRAPSIEAFGDSETGRSQSILLTQATQDAVNTFANGVTKWETVRENISTGQDFYFSNDVVIGCTGCVSGSGTQGALQLQIDFGARTIGGTGIVNPYNSSNQSFIHIHGLSSAGAGDTAEQTINSKSFADLTGETVLILRNNASAANELDLTNVATFTSGGSCSTCFDGTKITLQNAGGVLAGEAKVELSFSGSTGTSGAASISNGNFTAPR